MVVFSWMFFLLSTSMSGHIQFKKYILGESPLAPPPNIYQGKVPFPRLQLLTPRLNQQLQTMLTSSTVCLACNNNHKFWLLISFVSSIVGFLAAKDFFSSCLEYVLQQITNVEKCLMCFHHGFFTSHLNFLKIASFLIYCTLPE